MNSRDGLFHIFSFCMPHEIALCGRVNKLWRHVSLSNSLWKQFIDNTNVLSVLYHQFWNDQTRSCKQDFENFTNIRLEKYKWVDRSSQYEAISMYFVEKQKFELFDALDSWDLPISKLRLYTMSDFKRHFSLSQLEHEETIQDRLAELPINPKIQTKQELIREIFSNGRHSEISTIHLS
jgi:hypothetical protein